MADYVTRTARCCRVTATVNKAEENRIVAI